MHIIVHNCHITQHRTALTSFLRNLQTIIITQMLSIAQEGVNGH